MSCGAERSHGFPRLKCARHENYDPSCKACNCSGIKGQTLYIQTTPKPMRGNVQGCPTIVHNHGHQYSNQCSNVPYSNQQQHAPCNNQQQHAPCNNQQQLCGAFMDDDDRVRMGLTETMPSDLETARCIDKLQHAVLVKVKDPQESVKLLNELFALKKLLVADCPGKKSKKKQEKEKTSDTDGDKPLGGSVTQSRMDIGSSTGRKTTDGSDAPVKEKRKASDANDGSGKEKRKVSGASTAPEKEKKPSAGSMAKIPPKEERKTSNASGSSGGTSSSGSQSSHGSHKEEENEAK